MTVAALHTDDAAGVNDAFQTDSSVNITFNQIRLKSNSASASRQWFGIRFPTTPVGLTAANLVQAQLQLTGNNNTNNDLNGEVYGHKVSSSAAFNNGAGNNISSRTRTTAHFPMVSIDQPAFKSFPVPDAGNLVTVLQEIMSVSGWTGGNPLTLIFSPNTNAAYEWRGYDATNDDYKPRLLLNFGNPGDNPVYFDFYAGPADSTVAYNAHDGFDRGTLQQVLLPNCNFFHCAAGMGADSGFGGLGGGDNFRGYTPGGIYQRELLGRYGDDIVMHRWEHAAVGSTAQQWEVGIGSGTFWGNIATPGTLRYNLANPQSLTGNQLVAMNLGPNDLVAFGAANRLVYEEDPDQGDADWEAYVVDNIEPAVRACVDEVYTCVPDDSKCWIMISGYPNFCVIDRTRSPTTSTIIFPNGMSNPVFRVVWAADGAMGDTQWNYDTIDQGIHPGPNADGHRDYQSALIRFTIDRQQKANPADCPEVDGTAGKHGPTEYNPAAGSFDTAKLNVNFPSLGPLSYTTWSYSYGHASQGGAVSTSGWHYGLRNITDITVNRRMALLDEMNRRIAADYPRVIFADARHLMPVDTTNSADPSSDYAQSDQSYWVEGIHLNDTGATLWLNADGGVLDQLVRRVPFLQQFDDRWTLHPSGDPISVAGAWSGAALAEISVTT